MFSVIASSELVKEHLHEAYKVLNEFFFGAGFLGHFFGLIKAIKPAFLTGLLA
jgi:hypothetical protein